MIWLTWRQFRASATMLAAVLLALFVTLAVTGPGIASRYSAGVAKCTHEQEGACGQFFDRFFDTYALPDQAASLTVLVIPALAGLFWGAPLITRELEAGTHLLAWNQSVTRRRWLAIKLGLMGLTAVAAAGVCGLVVTWWSGPLDKSAPPDMAQMTPLMFAARGIAPMGYAAFAFVLGVTVGMLVRRTLAAMALTLVVFVAIQLAMPLLVRPHLMTPVTSTHELSWTNVEFIGVPPDGGGAVDVGLQSAVPGDAGAWVLSSELVGPDGRTIPANTGQGDPFWRVQGVSTTSGPCSAQAPPDGCLVELNRLGYQQRATYHPLDRFWTFQWIETGIYAALTAGLTWLCFWWIRRRPS